MTESSIGQLTIAVNAKHGSKFASRKESSSAACFVLSSPRAIHFLRNLSPRLSKKKAAVMASPSTGSVVCNDVVCFAEWRSCFPKPLLAELCVLAETRADIWRGPKGRCVGSVRLSHLAAQWELQLARSRRERFLTKADPSAVSLLTRLSFLAFRTLLRGLCFRCETRFFSLFLFSFFFICEECYCRLTRIAYVFSLRSFLGYFFYACRLSLRIAWSACIPCQCK